MLCAAMVLERIIGRDVARPVSDVDFNNVHYLRQMLYCVFKALHKAQRKLAFHHADLRLPNIMELFPSANNDNQPTVSTPRSGTIQSASLYDSQHVSGVLDYLAASALNEIRTQPSTHAPVDVITAASVAASQQLSSRILARPSPYMRDLAGFETSELRAAHFKIIDFGLADFRETFGAGYVSAKQDSLIHSQPHRQPSLQSLLAQKAAGDADGQEQQPQQSRLMSNSKIEWHTGSTPRKLNRKRSARIPAVMLPEVSSSAANCLSVCPICPSVLLFVSVSICLSVCLSFCIKHLMKDYCCNNHAL